MLSNSDAEDDTGSREGLGAFLNPNPVESALGCLDQISSGVGCVVFIASVVAVAAIVLAAVASGDLDGVVTLVGRLGHELVLAILLCAALSTMGVVVRWFVRRRYRSSDRRAMPDDGVGPKM